MLDDLKITITLFIFFHQVFTFNAVHIKVQPSNKVKNGAPMSIICRADISKSTNFNLRHNITIFKDGKLVFMSVSGKGEARYEVPMARSSHTGDYHCAVEADGRIRYSDSLHVWGPPDHQCSQVCKVFEGEVVTLRCELPEEVPPLHFIFRKMKMNMNSTPKEKLKFESQRNFSVIEFPVEEGDNILQFDCFGKRNVKFEFETSEHSNKTLITVKEPFIKPTLRIKPSSNITEGKEIQFECSTVVAKMHDIEIILLRNKTILSSVRDQTTLKYSAVATLEDSGEYICKVEERKASKIAKQNVVVAELFPKPILTASMNKLDENKELTLSCSIKDFQNASFSILRRNSNGDILLRKSRNFTMRANVNDSGSYICKAEVNRIVKESKPVMIQVYVIYVLLSMSSLCSNHPCFCQLASFPHSLEGICGDLTLCNVIAPVSTPNISVPSGLPEVVLGRPLKLTCCLIMGTPPITFTFYKGNKAKKEIVTNNTHKEMSRQDTGTYYCIASNRANVSAKSHPIAINVILASWQKGVITAFVLIPIAGVVILAVWWFWCKKKNGNYSLLFLC
uniref:Platelet endothelial cell adhesion molecule n=1 Tax=Phasianus colchicus TaxID=9054 RepID=A0A669Q8W5_PHACC